MSTEASSRSGICRNGSTGRPTARSARGHLFGWPVQFHGRAGFEYVARTPARHESTTADLPHHRTPGDLHMQTTDNATTSYEGASMRPAGAPVQPGASALAPDTTLADYKVIRRNGTVVSFEPSKIAIAVTKAFLAVNGGQGAASARVRELVEQLTQAVVRALVRSRPHGGTFHIEDIQDQVELALMRGGEHNVARAYVLYREKRSQERAHEALEAPNGSLGLTVTDGGVSRP